MSRLLLISSSFLLVATAALGAEAGGEPQDFSVVVAAIITALTPAVIAAVKGFAPLVPKNVLPILAPLIGAGADLLLQKSTGMGVGTVSGALLGLAGVGLREAGHQLRKPFESVRDAKARQKLQRERGG